MNKRRRYNEQRGAFVLAAVVTVLVAAFFGWLILRDDPNIEPAAVESGTVSPTVGPDPTATEPPTTEPSDADEAESDPTDTSDPDTSDPETSDPETTEPNTTEPATAEPDATDPDTAEPDTTEVPVETDPDEASTDPGTAGTFARLPDGSPVPIIAIYNGSQITLSGYAPDAEARARLEGLAIANSSVPDATVVNLVLIDPAVPTDIGVRVIEMQSARFPTSSSEILPAHAAELDRVVSVLKALPETTVDVIGHADQRGDAAANQARSQERAQAVADYLAFHGIDRSRITARAVGENDLLTLDDDAAALALNRRTEFIFYGLLES